MKKIIIIGGGAAGMMTAIFAARAGHDVHIYEKNEKLGKKLFITGKGRCNFTNDCDPEEMLSAVFRNAKFLYSSIYGFTSQDCIQFFENIGLETKVERGNRAFPASDHSYDVIRALENELRRLGVKIHLHTSVKSIVSRKGKVEQYFSHIILNDGEKISADACVVATGGLSYQTTGSTGDGYKFAKENGHSVTQCMPSLVSIEVKEAWIDQLQGLSLRNVEVKVANPNGKKKPLFQEFGEMLFTHYGISGPLILSMSAEIGDKLEEISENISGTADTVNKKTDKNTRSRDVEYKGIRSKDVEDKDTRSKDIEDKDTRNKDIVGKDIRNKNIGSQYLNEVISERIYIDKDKTKNTVIHGLKMTIDLKPALDFEQLDLRIQRDFKEMQNKQFKNSISKLLPSKLIPIIVMLSEIDPYKHVNLITKEERLKLVTLLKEFPLTLTKLRGYNEAVITRGGILIKEVDPSTMESKLVKGLYFIGEVLDLDAKTGGFNLQIAWSTAVAAGRNL
jgi:predicted Rossmann fold flavoprotein